MGVDIPGVAKERPTGAVIVDTNFITILKVYLKIHVW